MPDTTTTLAVLRDAVRRFADERDWEQFHSPKNLSMGLAVEAGELMEHFLWLEGDASRRHDPGQDRQKRPQVPGRAVQGTLYGQGLMFSRDAIAERVGEIEELGCSSSNYWPP